MQKEEILSTLKDLYVAGGSGNMENLVKRAPADSIVGNSPLGSLKIYNQKAKDVAQELRDLGFVVGVFDQLTTPVQITDAGIEFLRDNGVI